MHPTEQNNFTPSAWCSNCKHLTPIVHILNIIWGSIHPPKCSITKKRRTHAPVHYFEHRVVVFLYSFTPLATTRILPSPFVASSIPLTWRFSRYPDWLLKNNSRFEWHPVSNELFIAAIRPTMQSLWKFNGILKLGWNRRARTQCVISGCCASSLFRVGTLDFEFNHQKLKWKRHSLSR